MGEKQQMKDVIDFLNAVSKVSNDLREPINIYSSLEKKYIKANNQELLNDLYKEKRVIFSYLKNFEKSSLKQVKAFLKELNDNMDLNEVKILNSPKDINFVKIAYKSGKWAVSTETMKEPVETKDVPTAIEYLTQIVARLDPQEAAYSLLHAKNNGLFLVAALPDTSYTQSEPNTTIHNFEPAKDSVYTTNTPVSLQAEEDEYEAKEKQLEKEIKEGSVYTDKNEGIHSITTIAGENVIFADNEKMSLYEVEEKVNSGEWKKQAAISTDKIEKELNKYSEAYEELEVINQTITRMVEEMRSKLEEIASKDIEVLNKKIEKVEPKLKQKLAALEEYNRNLSNTNSKLTILKQKVKGLTLTYSPKVDEYQRRTLQGEKLQAVVDKMKLLIDPKNLKKFQKYESELYYYSSRAESFGYKLDMNSPEVQNKIEEKTKELKKQIGSSLKSNKNKSEAYEKLDKMIYAGKISFNVYNELSDCVEHNSEISNKYISEIYASMKEDRTPKVIESGVFDSIKTKLGQVIDGVKEWFEDFFNFLTIQNDKVVEINSDLDEIIGE